MQQEKHISRGIVNRDFRSPFLFLSAVLCIAASICSIPGIGILFDKEAAELYQIFLSLDYIDTSAQQSWLFVRGLINVLALAVPLLIGIGLCLLIAATFAHPAKKLPMWGLGYFSVSAKLFRIVVYVVGILLAVLFVFRALRYMIVNGAQIGGVLFIFAMLLPECVFLAVVAIIFVLTLRCMKSVINTLDTLRLNALTGGHESYGLTSGAVWLIAMIGVSAVVLGIISEDRSGRLCFGFAALADFLLAVWLVCYRKKNGKRALAQFRKDRSGSGDIFV